MRSVYLDYNATTPLDPEIRDAMLPFLGDLFGNPSSIHHVGRRTRASLDAARERVAALFRCKPSEIVFTSGGTESNNLALFGAAKLRQPKGNHIVVSSIEHHAVLHPARRLAAREGFSLTELPVDNQGLVHPEQVAEALRPETILVSIMSANNETGAIQPVAEIGKICRNRGILFHTDAVQWFGKMPFSSIDQFEADLVSVCAHKLHGPKGAGLLFIRSPVLPDPLLFGGAHENERRAGTENLASIIGLAAALEKFSTSAPFQRIASLTNRLESFLRQLPGVAVQSANAPRLPNTVSFTAEGCDSIALLAGLDLEGICASSGAACSAGSLEPSHVLKAMGVPDSLANSFVRFSLGPATTETEIAQAEQVLPLVLSRIRCA